MSAFGYRKPADLPQTIALFPLNGAILFPRGVLALNIFEPRYLNMIDDALGAERMIGIIQPATGEDEEPIPELSDVGTLGRITSFAETDDGRYLVTLTGVCRFTCGREIEAGKRLRRRFHHLAGRHDRSRETDRFAADLCQFARLPSRLGVR